MKVISKFLHSSSNLRRTLFLLSLTDPPALSSCPVLIVTRSCWCLLPPHGPNTSRAIKIVTCLSVSFTLKTPNIFFFFLCICGSVSSSTSFWWTFPFPPPSSVCAASLEHCVSPQRSASHQFAPFLLHLFSHSFSPHLHHFCLSPSELTLPHPSDTVSRLTSARLTPPSPHRDLSHPTNLPLIICAYPRAANDQLEGLIDFGLFFLLIFSFLL